MTDAGGRAVYGVGLRQLACWVCGFQSRQGMDNCLLQMMCVVQIGASSTGRSLIQGMDIYIYILHAV